MAKQVRPGLTKPDTNHEPKVRAPDKASTSGFHQGQRNQRSSLEGRMYGCNLYLPPMTARLSGKPGSVHVWFVGRWPKRNSLMFYCSGNAPVARVHPTVRYRAQPDYPDLTRSGRFPVHHAPETASHWAADLYTTRHQPRTARFSAACRKRNARACQGKAVLQWLPRGRRQCRFIDLAQAESGNVQLMSASLHHHWWPRANSCGGRCRLAARRSVGRVRSG